MDDKTRKILIVSAWAPPAIGGPQNMYNLFSQFPNDSYCVLTSYYGIDEYSARNGTWLKGKYIFYDNPGFSDTPESRPEMSRESSGRKAIKRLRHAVKKNDILKIILGPFLIFSQIIMIVRAGLRAIGSEKIEVMLGVSDFGPALISTYLLHKISKKPYVLHFYDIYFGNFHPWPGNLLARFFERPLLKNAETVIVTNDGTREFYETRYGKDFAKFTVIYNAVFPTERVPAGPPRDPKEPRTILFTGRIYWAQAESLKNLVKAVDGIRDGKIKLLFYVPQPPEYVRSIGFDLSKITLASAPPDKMPEIQSKADILFLPLSWHTKSPQIIATATPGKLSDYLASGRPILIHAPAWTTLARYAKENDCALVVDENDVGKLREAIVKLLTDKKLGQKLARNAKNLFAKNHDAKKCILEFRRIFLKADD